MKAKKQVNSFPIAESVFLSFWGNPCFFVDFHRSSSLIRWVKYIIESKPTGINNLFTEINILCYFKFSSQKEVFTKRKKY